MAKVKISDLIPQSEHVETGRGQLEIRHLTLPEVVNVLVNHKEVVLTMVASSLTSGVPDFPTLLRTAPDVAAIIIAHAADAPEEVEDVKRLPPGTQIIALNKIWKMSIPDPKALAAALQALASMMPAASPPSEKSSGKKAPPSEPEKS